MLFRSHLGTFFSYFAITSGQNHFISSAKSKKTTIFPRKSLKKQKNNENNAKKAVARHVFASKNAVLPQNSLFVKYFFRNFIQIFAYFFPKFVHFAQKTTSLHNIIMVKCATQPQIHTLTAFPQSIGS